MVGLQKNQRNIGKMKTRKIKISELKPGMKIKSFDEKTNEIVFAEVEDIWKTDVDVEQQRLIKFKDGTSFVCSSTHPIVCLHAGKISELLPDQITSGYLVITDDGKHAIVDHIEKYKTDSQFYDLSVRNTGVFFAAKDLKSPMILTHNCSQGAIRSSSGTAYYPFFTYEFEDLVVLKNNKGTEYTRARELDYAVQLNRLAYQRLIDGGVITFFSMSDVPGLYEAFFADQDEFERLYAKYEKDTTIRKKTMTALDMFTMLMQERNDTGRIYIMNVDHANNYGAFDPKQAPIYLSNLCTEVLLPTQPLTNVDNDDGMISLCTLAAINLGNIKTPEDFERPARLVVRFLNQILDYQNYPVPAAKNSVDAFRPLGVGLINLAYFIAKHNYKYSNPEVLEFLQPYFEAYSYYLIKESMIMAKETGPCRDWKKTKYGQGILPAMNYKKELDEFVENNLLLDWQELANNCKQYGTKNATLTAIMPAETSAMLSNATNGIEPPRALVSIKGSKDGSLKQVVPEIRRLKNKYELLWDQRSPDGYLKICGLISKFIDQSVSANTSYNPDFYENGEIPMSVLLTDLLLTYKIGLSTLYYNNTYDADADNKKLTEVNEEKLEKLEELECEACVI